MMLGLHHWERGPGGQEQAGVPCHLGSQNKDHMALITAVKPPLPTALHVPTSLRSEPRSSPRSTSPSTTYPIPFLSPLFTLLQPHGPPHCSSTTPGTVLPQDLCICSVLCPENPFPPNTHTACPPRSLLQVSP